MWTKTATETLGQTSLMLHEGSELWMHVHIDVTPAVTALTYASGLIEAFGEQSDTQSVATTMSQDFARS